MAKKQPTPSPASAAEVCVQPTVYTFNFKDVPVEKYGETLTALFRNPDFDKAVEKRNRLVKSSSRMRRGSAELASLVRAVQQQDHRLADLVFACLVQANLRSEESLQTLSFSSLLRYHTDYSREGVENRVEALTSRLYQLTFLADMIEAVAVDVKADMDFIFNGEMQFQQFDGVVQVLKQLRGYFSSVRPQEYESADARLYLDYSDSINEYLAKRLRTYTEKVRKLHPAARKRQTEAQLLAALHQFAGQDVAGVSEKDVVRYTESHSPYLNVFSLLPTFSEDVKRKFERHFHSGYKGLIVEDTPYFNMAATDVILCSVSPDKKES